MTPTGFRLSLNRRLFTAEDRLKACLDLFDRQSAKLWARLDTPAERLIVCTPDLCVWMTRRFRFQSKRFTRKGASRGIRILQLGWVTLSARY